MTDFLDEKPRRRSPEELTKLTPLVEEYRRLEAASEALPTSRAAPSGDFRGRARPPPEASRPRPAARIKDDGEPHCHGCFPRSYRRLGSRPRNVNGGGASAQARVRGRR